MLTYVLKVLAAFVPSSRLIFCTDNYQYPAFLSLALLKTWVIFSRGEIGRYPFLQLSPLSFVDQRYRVQGTMYQVQDNKRRY